MHPCRIKGIIYLKKNINEPKLLYMEYGSICFRQQKIDYKVFGNETAIKMISTLNQQLTFFLMSQI